MFRGVFIFIMFLFYNCAGETGTGGGNPLIAEKSVTVQSDSYTNDGTLVLFQSPYFLKLEKLFISRSYAGVVTDFQFCITQLKVKSSSSSGTTAATEVVIGLVDVSDQNATINWGDFKLNSSTDISEIHFEIHSDSENCSGEDFSVSYNGVTITQDLEFKFQFDPAITIENGDTITLGLSPIAKAFQDAADAGEFTNEQIGPYMENIFGDAEK